MSAYEVIDARPGVVLVSTGAGEMPGQPYFRDAAILLVKVCEHHPMIFGVSLSTVTNETMAAHFCPSARQAYPAFGNNSVHLGGPIGPHWTVLHTTATAGSLELAPGMHAGGCLRDAQRQVDAGRATAADFHFYSGYASWSIDELNKEIAAGKWRLAQASSNLIFSEIRADGGRKLRATLLDALGRT